MDALSNPWPWYVSGPAIALIMFLLLKAGGNFGVSSTLRSICAMGGAGKRIAFFNFDWQAQRWNLVFVLGAVVGGYLASTHMASETQISDATVADLAALGIAFDGGLAPKALFSWGSLATWRGVLVLVVGGFMVGFGSRWAGGCTSGHAISGLSNLQVPSLIAVVGFFIGGLVMTHLLFPIIF